MLFDIEDYTTTYRAIQDALDKEAFESGVDFEYNTWMPTVANLLESRGSIMGDKEDDHTTARATRDAFAKAVGEYYQCLTHESLSGIVLAETKKDEIDLAFVELAPHWRNFWNAMVSFNVYGQGFVNGDYVESSDIIFTIMTQEIYDDYYVSLKNYMTKVRNLIEAFGDTIQ